MDDGSGGAESIYKISRKVKRKEESLYNALRSIYDDAGFVAEIQGLRPELPLLANLRCGLWYSRKFDDVCYFKSTDGHTGNWAFSPTRLNIHVAALAATRGGCMIVDATRKGKRFPDSMSKTIPIWTCVLNNGIARLRQAEGREVSAWDTELHLPNWVSATERSRIESRIQDWVDILFETGADLESLSSALGKPLRPLWISQKSLIWLDEVPETSSLNFTPIILVSASKHLSVPLRISDAEFSWSYIPGAADDEESWARGLTPSNFWKHSAEIISSGADECNRIVALLVERERVSKNLCGEKLPTTDSLQTSSVYMIGSTGIAVFSGDMNEELFLSFDSVICCCGPLPRDHSCCLRLEIKDYKFDRHSLEENLAVAVEFSRKHLLAQNRLLIYSRNAEDIAISVCLTILIFCFNRNGEFDNGNEYASVTEISKVDIRQRLIYVCSFVSNAHPSRGMLRQVYNFARKASANAYPIV